MEASGEPTAIECSSAPLKLIAVSYLSLLLTARSIDYWPGIRGYFYRPVSVH